MIEIIMLKAIKELNDEFFKDAEKTLEHYNFTKYKILTYEYQRENIEKKYKIQLCFLERYQIDFKELYTRIYLDKILIFHNNDNKLTTTN